jgi:hypothetical protein
MAKLCMFFNVTGPNGVSWNKRICEAIEAAKLHPHRQILPFNKRCADMVRVGVALPHLGYNPRDAPNPSIP